MFLFSLSKPRCWVWQCELEGKSEEVEVSLVFLTSKGKEKKGKWKKKGGGTGGRTPLKTRGSAHSLAGYSLQQTHRSSLQQKSPSVPVPEQNIGRASVFGKPSTCEGGLAQESFRQGENQLHQSPGELLVVFFKVQTVCDSEDFHKSQIHYGSDVTSLSQQNPLPKCCQTSHWQCSTSRALCLLWTIKSGQAKFWQRTCQTSVNPDLFQKGCCLSTRWGGSGTCPHWYRGFCSSAVSQQGEVSVLRWEKWKVAFCGLRLAFLCSEMSLSIFEMSRDVCLLSPSSNSAVAPDQPLAPKAAERRFWPLAKEWVASLNSWLLRGFWFMTPCSSRLLWLEVSTFAALCLELYS